MGKAINQQQFIASLISKIRIEFFNLFREIMISNSKFLNDLTNTEFHIYCQGIESLSIANSQFENAKTTIISSKGTELQISDSSMKRKQIFCNYPFF